MPTRQSARCGQLADTDWIFLVGGPRQHSARWDDVLGNDGLIACANSRPLLLEPVVFACRDGEHEPHPATPRVGSELSYVGPDPSRGVESQVCEFDCR